MTEQKKEKRVSLRLDNETAEKLEKVMKARDVSQSDAIRLCIQGSHILQIGDTKNLALEFCRIRMALDKGYVNEEVRKEVNTLCQSIGELLLQTEESIESEIE